MVDESRIDIFDKTLNDGDEKYTWKALNPDLPTIPADGTRLCSDPFLKQEMEYFILKPSI